MKNRNLIRSLKLAVAPVLSAAVALAIFSACSKKAPEAAATPAPETQPVAATPAPEGQPADATPQQPTGPVLDASQMTGDAKTAMAEADAAMRQHEYQKAVQTLLAIQKANLDAKQAALAHQQMINLQHNLANAAANGDPNAVAAAEALRAAHRH